MRSASTDVFFPPLSLSLFQAAALSLDHTREKSTDAQPSQHLLWKAEAPRCAVGLESLPQRHSAILQLSLPELFAKQSISSVGGPGTQLEMRRKGELNIEELHIQTLSISGAAQPAFVEHWLIPCRFSLRHVFRKRSFGIALISADRSIRVDVYWKKETPQNKTQTYMQYFCFSNHVIYLFFT